jgi:hypothetical protein
MWYFRYVRLEAAGDAERTELLMQICGYRDQMGSTTMVYETRIASDVRNGQSHAWPCHGMN